MESVADLLFEFTNEDRLAILELLSTNPASLTNIYKTLKLKPPETSRHLTRLLEKGLISKAPNGYYSLTTVGFASHSLLSGYRFLNDNKEYFNEHSLELIPMSLMLRIGELEGAVFLDDVLSSIYEAEKLVTESKRYTHSFSDQIPMNILPKLEKMKEQEIEFQVIFPNNMSPPKDYVSKASYEGVINKYRDSIPAYLAVNENRALIGFNYKDGRVDHRIFDVRHETGRLWCEELFQYYWTRTSNDIPEFYQQYIPENE